MHRHRGTKFVVTIRPQRMPSRRYESAALLETYAVHRQSTFLPSLTIAATSLEEFYYDRIKNWALGLFLNSECWIKNKLELLYNRIRLSLEMRRLMLNGRLPQAWSPLHLDSSSRRRRLLSQNIAAKSRSNGWQGYWSAALVPWGDKKTLKGPLKEGHLTCHVLWQYIFLRISGIWCSASFR